MRCETKSSGRACKPDFVPHCSCELCAAIIPLGHGSRHGSSSLPEGCSWRRLAPPRRERIHCNSRREAEIARTLTRRAGPALPSYLALHHAGFSVPRALLRERWALTPPFHPYQRIVRRHLAGHPARRHRAVPRRSVFCGTFRERIALPRCAPLELPGALPLLPMTRDGVRTVLPLETSCDEPASDHPAHPLRTFYLTGEPAPPFF